jgi:circadian clock protein KaiC
MPEAVINSMRLTSGVPGLDQILQGGLLSGRVYLVHGEPGTGKTTLGLHFLSTCEDGLFITFGQSAEHLRFDASSLGMDISAVTILDLTPTPEIFSAMQTYDIFSPLEVEREPISQQMAKAFEELNPQRIFVDGFGMFRNLASDAFQHSRLAQSFFRFATRQGGTLIVASEDSECARFVDGVIELKFSREGRSVRVTKFRGSDFREGCHPMRLTSSGLQISLNAA